MNNKTFGRGGRIGPALVIICAAQGNLKIRSMISRSDNFGTKIDKDW